MMFLQILFSFLWYGSLLLSPSSPSLWYLGRGVSLSLSSSSLWYGGVLLSPSSFSLWYWGRGSLCLSVPLLYGMGGSLYLLALLPCGTGESFYLQAPSPLGMIPLRNMLVLIWKSVIKQHRIIPDSALPTSWMFVLCLSPHTV